MTDDEDLRINTLHRFAKHSPRLALYEYSHCEIPAGCGGVVLRWIDPAQGWPARVSVQLPNGSSTVWLDGIELDSSLVMLGAGLRTVGLHCKREQPGPQPLMLTIAYDSGDLDVVARGAPQWRGTTVQPPAGWADPAFDDASWPAIPSAPAALIAAQPRWYLGTFEEHVAAGGSVFALDADELWVRVQFTAPEPPEATEEDEDEEDEAEDRP